MRTYNNRRDPGRMGTYTGWNDGSYPWFLILLGIFAVAVFGYVMFG